MDEPNRLRSPRRYRSRLLALVVAGAAVLAACGSDDASGSASGSESTPDCRQVEHLGGTSCVPLNPQRIVVLDPFTVLPTLLDLDAPIVGATSVYPSGAPFPDYIDPKAVEGIEIVGSALAPNVEAIAALHPDLIVAMTAAVTDIEDQLARIAPTVVTRFSFYNADWRDDVRTIAGLVDGGPAIEGRLDELEARSQQVAQRLATRPTKPTLSNLTIDSRGVSFYRYGCTWIGDVLRRAGVDQPAAQEGDSCTQDDPMSTVVLVSPELLPVVDAEAIVAFAHPSRDGTPAVDPFGSVADTPLWRSLGAVKDERAFALGEPWGYGGSITAALLVLDDLDRIVFPEP